jgi:hypothetical protein
VDLVAVLGVCSEHLASDLCVTRLVSADEADLISTEEGDEAVEEEVTGDEDEYDELPEGDANVSRETIAPAPQQGGLFREGDGLGVLGQLRFLVRPRGLT